MHACIYIQQSVNLVWKSVFDDFLWCSVLKCKFSEKLIFNLVALYKGDYYIIDTNFAKLK